MVPFLPLMSCERFKLFVTKEFLLQHTCMKIITTIRLRNMVYRPSFQNLANSYLAQILAKPSFCSKKMHWEWRCKSKSICLKKFWKKTSSFFKGASIHRRTSSYKELQRIPFVPFWLFLLASASSLKFHFMKI